MPILMPSPLEPKSLRLVLPTDRLSVHEVTLPPTPAHRLLAALAGALEEQLLDDPADLHFALAPHADAAIRAGRSFEVMVCDKAWLTGLLAQTKAQGNSVVAIVPEDSVRQLAGWNLAQFDFRAKPRLTLWLQTAAKLVGQSPEWRWARIGLAALLIVQLIGINLWAWRDRAALAAKREQVHRILMQTYPQTQVVVDAPLQMARALARDSALRGGLVEQGLEAQLASKALAGKAYGQVDYANSELKLTELRAGAQKP